MTDTVLSDYERQFIQELIDSPGKTLNVHFGVKGIVYVHYEKSSMNGGLITLKSSSRGSKGRAS